MSNSRRINLQKYVFNDIDIGNKKEVEKILLFEISKGNFEVVNELLFLGLDLNCVDSNGSNALHYSAYNNNVEALKFLTSKNINLNQVNNYGHTAIFTSVISKSHNAYEFLINKFDTFQIDKEGYSLLHYSLTNEDYKIVKDLIENYGFDLNLIDKNNCNLLHYCSKHTNTDILEFILNKNKNLLELVNDKSRTPLFEAAFNKNAKVTKLLLDKGSKFDINNITHVEMLTEIIFGNKYKNIIDAIKNDDIKAIEFFKHNGVNVNSMDKQNNSLLLIACMYSKPETIFYLINNEADVNLHNNLGFTPLMYASKRGYIDVVNSLLGFNINPNEKTKDNTSALILACENNNTLVVNTLLKNGANPNTIDNNGFTPLLYASRNGNEDIVTSLIKYEADINYETTNKITALILAAENNQRKALNVLLKSGAKFDIKGVYVRDIINTKWNLKENIKNIHASIEYRNQEIINFFLDNGIDINEKDLFGNTPLIIATLNNDMELIKFLLSKKADANIYNNKRLTPHIYSACLGYKEIFELLLKYTYTKVFEELVNSINLDGHQGIELIINNIDNDVVVTKLGVKIEYSINGKNSHLRWEQQEHILISEFKTKRLQLFDNLNGKYGVLFLDDSTESDLILDLEISNTKPYFIDLLEIEHRQIFLFENINGVKIDEWEREKKLIEDILNISVEIQQYDRFHSYYNPNIFEGKAVMVVENFISAIPKKFQLSGKFYKEEEDSNSTIKYYFEEIEKNDFDKWTDTLGNICKYLKTNLFISTKDTNKNLIVLQESIEVKLPKILGLEDDKGRIPKLLLSKEDNGNRYFYYSYIPTISYKNWENKIRINSLQTLFNKSDAVYNIIECDSNHVDFDKSINENQVILVKELTPIKNFIPLTSAHFLRDEQIFWGYGAGGLEYYTNINDVMHMMVIGGTGSGKSTFMNGIILSLIHNIDKIGKIYLIDLKSGVEFNKYKKLESNKVTVFSRGTKPSKLLKALQEVEAEMYLRNEYLAANEVEKLREDPYFIIIDEFAQIDLMPEEDMEERSAKREIENTLLKIGSLARASNIKLFVQTQDPSVVSGELKKHLMSRILLKTGNLTDSRQTLQNPDELEILGLNHVKFAKGRFVFEDYNDGDTKLTELQYPYLVRDDNSGNANLDYFLNYKDKVNEHNNSKLDLILEQYKDIVKKEYTHLNETDLLNDVNITNVSHEESDVLIQRSKLHIELSSQYDITDDYLADF